MIEIDESDFEARVYYKKLDADFYLVNVSIGKNVNAGLFITSIVVARGRNGELYAKPPGFDYGGKPIKQVELDSDGWFWSVIKPLVLRAVHEYKSKTEHDIPQPEEESDDIEANMDKTIAKIGGLNPYG